MQEQRTFFPELERLRAIACIMVWFQHFVYIAPLKFVKDNVPYFLHDGWGGLHLFFVISGFIITYTFYSSLSKVEGNDFFERVLNARVQLKQFWTRRFFRLAPLALTMIFFAFASFLLAYSFDVIKKPDNWEQPFVRMIFDYFFMIYDYVIVPLVDKEQIHFGAFGPYWTLSVEGQFYLLWPIIFLALKKPSKQVAFCLISAAAVLIFIRPLAMYFGGSSLAYYHSYTNFDGLFIGAFLALLYIYRPSRGEQGHKVFRNLLALFLLTAIWIYPSLVESDKTPAYSYVPVIISSAILVWMAVQNSGYVLEIPFLNKLFEAIGKRSYAIYITQLILCRAVTWLMESYGMHSDNPDYYFYQFAFSLGTLVIFVELSHRLLETPMRKYGKKVAAHIT